MARPKKSDKPTLAPVLVETKEQKLIRLASKRVEKACHAIALLGNLATYKPTESDVDQIMEALGQTCGAVEQRLRGTSKVRGAAFQLRNIPASHG